MMKIHWAFIPIFAAIGGASPEAAEIAFDEVPQVVKEAFQQAHPNAKEVEVEKEDGEYGEPLYEFEFRENGKEYEALYHTDGSFFGYEQEIPFTKLPKSIQEQVQRQFPKGEIAELEVVVDDNGKPLAYEVEVKDNGVEWEVYFNADGSFINKSLPE